MNNFDTNTLASLVLSGAGESLYEMGPDHGGCDISQPPANDPVAPPASRPVRSRIAGSCGAVVAALGSQSAMAANSPYVSYSGGGAVPGEFAVLLWAPVLLLTLGCAIGLLVSIVVQSRRSHAQAASSATPVQGSERLGVITAEGQVHGIEDWPKAA